MLNSSADLERLALALGQDAELLRQIKDGEVHPAMMAFGLWCNEAGLETLVDEIYANRARQTPRSEVTL